MSRRTVGGVDEEDTVTHPLPHQFPDQIPDPTEQPIGHASHRSRVVVAAAGATALVAGGALAGAAAVTGLGTQNAVAGRGSVAAPTVPAVPAQQGDATTTGAATATAAQQVGVVDIDTVLGYTGGRSAGTGMVLSADGEVLTNNHVVRGATSITVTVVTTGRRYAASVVGTDPTDDVAVLRLRDASGLQTAHLGDAAGLRVGEAVTGVGNAGGAGGTPSAASGSVVALGRTITAADQDGSNAETLDGLIQTDAAIQAGDSGGPLYDSRGEVVGMDTAASTTTAGFGPGSGAAAIESYAIPIQDALAVATRIEHGESSSTVHQGLPAFLGVSVAGVVDTGGVLVGGVVDGGPAATAGIGAGDVITAVGGSDVTGVSDLHRVLAAHRPGDRVSLSWTDSSGQTRNATVTLVAGPAD